MVFSMKTLAFCNKSISEIERFDVYFDNLEQNPSVQATLKSEVSRLNDMKNCEQHSARIKQILAEYHAAVEENLRLKESNAKLAQARKSVEIKLEVSAKKL